MSQDKKMTLFIFGIVLIVVAVGGIWWLLFAHHENPPLPTKTIQIVGTTTAPTVAATSTPAVDVSPSVASVSAPSSVQAGENPPLPTESLGIDRATFTVEIASTIIQKTNGLSFRPSLAPGHGMLFIFSSPAIQNFWMKDMNFPIDMIWIGGGKVLGFAQNAAPQPGAQLWQLTIYSSPDGTDHVLEVPAGTVLEDNIQVGDTVSGI
jgi:uncharacterized membrane protein (UPF0127 family)